MARTNRYIGGENPMDRVQEDFAVVRPVKHAEKIDLDVYSSNNELPVGPSRYDETKTAADIESSKQSVPPLDSVDKENFFSDVE